MIPTIFNWIVIGTLTLIALFFAIAFVSAYFEKRKIDGFAPAGPDAPSERTGTAAAFLTHAENLEFRHVGYFIESSGWKRDYVSFLISADGLVLAMIVHGMAARFNLTSKLSNGQWLVTNRKPGEADLSGLRIEAHRPGMFCDLLAFHKGRVAEMQIGAVPFDPQRVIAEIAEHNRTRAQQLILTGIARWRDKDQSAWSYTILGSLRISMRLLSDVREAVRMEREAAKEAKEQLPTL